MVKAKDENDLESPWSESHTIMIYGNPHVTVTINKIKFRDEIDVLSEAEWFYRLDVEDEEITNHNTDNGRYNGNWVQNNIWEPKKDHEFEIENREANLKIKLMDHDEGLEGDKDDLADVSGCNHPDNDGADDSTPEKRGAIYHGKYDIINKELAEYSENPDDNSDKIIPSQDVGMYITSGDYEPDGSTEFEGGVVPNPENDAKIWFTITTDYMQPQTSIKISNQPDKIRTNSILKFKGSVTEGAPDYSWQWNFGDGTTSNKQNPEHSYSKSGQYRIELTVTDKFGQKDTSTLTIDVYKNQKPNNLVINGPSQGKKGEIQTYTFKAEDNDGDKLYYMVNWGDGTETGWLGPFLTGNEITKTKTWDKRGSYSIKFTVKDKYDATNSKTKSVSMPKQKNSFPRSLEKMLENLFQNFDFDLPKIFNFSLKTKY